ncbi:MAG: DNA-binding protein [Pelomonas sp.]|nr:DNA-binding protein [Roseateles sp.]
MRLQNLLRIGRLKAHEATPAEIQRLLGAVVRNLADAAVGSVSEETRFDAAYKAVTQCALVALMAQGFRPSGNESDPHLATVQSLPLTLGVEDGTSAVLDALRRKRNAIDDTGDSVSPDMLDECIAQAHALRAHLLQELAERHPELLS